MSRRPMHREKGKLTAESGAVVRRWGSELKVCLLYPNRYAVGMSNLGLQAVYSFLNGCPGVLCERAFVPDRGDEERAAAGPGLLSLETGRPLREFDVLAFSVSFEADYLNIPLLLRLGHLEPLAAGRGEDDPVVVGGGAAFLLNPEPVADFFDAICIGDGEALLPPLLKVLRETARPGLPGALTRVPGIYVPELYRPVYQEERQVALEVSPPAAPRVERAWVSDLDQAPAVSSVLTPNTEFGDMYLLEVSRGCPRGCRFCAAGYIYRPYRLRSFAEVARQAEEGLQHRGKIGLVGAAVSDYPDIGRLCAHILAAGGKVSLSSLRLDALDARMIEVLRESGHKTVAIAPEGGSQRLRDLVRKGVDEEQILEACERLVRSGILNIRLYFIIGLPTETSGDLEELVALVGKIRERILPAAREKGRIGRLVLSVNPFIPKPATPFQWCPMEKVKVLEEKERFLRRLLGPIPNVDFQMENPREAYLQAFLSRGDRRASAFLLDAVERGWKGALKRFSPHPDLFVHRAIERKELLPWDFLTGGDKGSLLREYDKAFGRAGCNA